MGQNQEMNHCQLLFAIYLLHCEFEIMSCFRKQGMDFYLLVKAIIDRLLNIVASCSLNGYHVMKANICETSKSNTRNFCVCYFFLLKMFSRRESLLSLGQNELHREDVKASHFAARASRPTRIAGKTDVRQPTEPAGVTMAQDRK